MTPSPTRPGGTVIASFMGSQARVADYSGVGRSKGNERHRQEQVPVGCSPKIRQQSLDGSLQPAKAGPESVVMFIYPQGGDRSDGRRLLSSKRAGSS